MIKDLRRELDDRGLEDVKVIAPEHSTVQVRLWNNAPIFADPAAVAALDGWGFHSYAMSMRKDALDSIRKYDIPEIWQTEAGCHDHGSESAQDSTNSATAAGLFLGDVNLGTNYWLYFLPYSNIDNASTDSTRRISGGIKFMGYTIDGNSQLVVMPKYYYFKQLSRAFRVGTSMRLCVSDLGNDGYRKYMYGTYGNRPHIHAAAGVRTDGKWTVSVVNVTGVPNRYWVDGDGVSHATMAFPAAETVTATVFIEELANAGTVVLAVERSNGTVKNQDGGTVTMVNGEVTVQVRPSELVTLITAESLVHTRDRADQNLPHKSASISLSPVQSGSGTAFRIRCTNFNGKLPAVVEVMNIQGKRIARIPVDNASVSGFDILWDAGKTPVAPGMYIVKIGGTTVSLPVMR